MGENSYYNDDDFWQKINTYAKLAGRKVIEKALQLYYAAADPEDAHMGKARDMGCADVFHCACRCHTLTWFRLLVSAMI